MQYFLQLSDNAYLYYKECTLKTHLQIYKTIIYLPVNVNFLFYYGKEVYIY